MPTITRWCIKTALAYALLGTALSTIWLINIVVPLHPLIAYLQPTALHLIVVGWLTQLIFGVALWMFPPWSREQPRGPEPGAWSAYALLNGGLLLRLIAEPTNSYRLAPTTGWLLVASAVLQTGAVLLLAALLWPRVRAKATRR
jgi:hypothetical protein